MILIYTFSYDTFERGTLLIKFDPI
jgi:hypothetical protein